MLTFSYLHEKVDVVGLGYIYNIQWDLYEDLPGPEETGVLMSELDFESNKRINPYYNNVPDIDPRSVNKYEFVTNFYEGTGGVFDGSYLKSYVRESFYENRKQMASYRNFLKPIVRATIDPVFSAPISRKTTNDIFASFLDDVTNSKVGINSFTDAVVTYTRLHGVCFVVMDNFSNIPESELEALESRAYPYMYIQPADTVDSYSIDTFGNLKAIAFKAVEVIDKKEIKVITTWDSEYMIKEWYDGDKLIKTESFNHALGVLPVIRLYLNDISKVLPQPPVYDMCKLSYTVFNKDSEIIDQERAQAFSIFYMQTDTENNNLTIGPRNAIIIPPGQDINITPGYVSPDPNILAGLVSNAEKLVSSLYQIASQAGVTAVKETSGVAEAYKFFANNEQLKKTATLAETFEKKVAELFGVYLNTTIDYEVSYSKQYDAFYAKASVDDFIKLLGTDLVPQVKTELKKSLVLKVLDNIDQSKLAELLKTLDEEPGDANVNQDQE